MVRRALKHPQGNSGRCVSAAKQTRTGPASPGARSARRGDGHLIVGQTACSKEIPATLLSLDQTLLGIDPVALSQDEVRQDIHQVFLTT